MSAQVYVLFVFVFILGTIVGSFLNVCICRIPEGRSIVSPPSHCPNCGALIRWYQNVPILSWLFLGGKCFSCKVPISWRYPFVELLNGFLFLAVFYLLGFHAATLVYWIFVSSLLVITFIDFDHQIIPDLISLPGIVVGFVGSFWVPWVSWSESLLGIMLGGGSLWLVAFAYHLFAKKEGMGGGDIKLLAMLGAFLGWKAILPIIFLSSFAGSLVGVPVMIAHKSGSKMALPFGPFLALGGMIYLFWGPLLIRWYFSLFL